MVEVTTFFFSQRFSLVCIRHRVYAIIQHTAPAGWWVGKAFHSFIHSCVSNGGREERRNTNFFALLRNTEGRSRISNLYEYRIQSTEYEEGRRGKLSKKHV